MLVIVVTALSIVHTSLAQDNFYSTDAKNTFKNDYDNNILREILQRIDKLQSHMDKMESKNNIRFDQMESNNNKRFDQLERNNNKRFDQMDSKNNIRLDQMERNNNKRFDQMERNNNIRFDQLEANIEADNKNLTVIMETIVEQQMVITAEIFTVSQTLPFCCCQYQNTTDRPEIETTTVDTGKPETTTPTALTSLPTDCAEAMGESNPDGVYQINVTNSNIAPFDIYCMKNVVESEKEKDINGTWMIIQRRQDNTTDFYRDWISYKRGFGDLTNSFWIGLDTLYALTKSTEHELWVQLESSTGLRGWEKYSHFSIGSESEKYALKTFGFHTGTAGDSLLYHKDNMWSTYDRDNDKLTTINCAEFYKGAWWFDSCRVSHLNGVTDIMWNTFSGGNTLKYAHMAIRPRK